MSAPVLLHDLLDGPACTAGRTALVQGEESLTYGGLRARVAELAGRLAEAGLRPGDRAAILLPKSIPECVALFAISRAGGVVVPVHPSLKGAQVRHILSDCGARVLVSDEGLLAGLGAALEGLSDLAVIRDSPAPPQSEVRGRDETCRPGTQGEGKAPVTRDPEDGSERKLAAILYTSGSTGLPKGVMLSHANLIAGTRIVRGYLGIGPDERILSVLPFSFDYGLNQLLTAVEQGATCVLLEFRFGDEVVRAIERHRITGLAGVPTLWSLLTRAAPSLKSADTSRLRYLTNSGGAVPQETVERLRNALPRTAIVLMYGLTEAFRSTWLPPEELAARPGSIGRAIPETEVFAVNAQGRRTQAGEPGILHHAGPTVSMGYWNRPEDTARVLVPDPRDPANGLVCRSGDSVVEDGDGYFRFLGREDATIKTQGFRVSPTEVEAALMGTGAFRQAAVIGLPDAGLGQRVHAVTVAAGEGAPDADILASLRRALAPHMVPRAIERVARLPLTPNGKVDYKRLLAERAGDG